MHEKKDVLTGISEQLLLDVFHPAALYDRRHHRPEYEVQDKDMEKEADDELYAEEGIFDVSGMFFDTPKRPLPIMSQPPPKRRKIQQPWEMQQQPWAVQQQEHYSPASPAAYSPTSPAAPPDTYSQHRQQPILQRRQQHTLQRRQQHALQRRPQPILQHRQQPILQRRPQPILQHRQQPILQRRRQPVLQHRRRNLNHRSQHMHPHHLWLVIRKV